MKSSEFKEALRSKKAVIPTAIALAIGSPMIAGCGSKTSAQSTRSAAEGVPAKVKEKSPKLPKGQDAGVGYDVSYPNQNSLPKPGAFAIVGLNGINAATFNPYFKRQLAWAKQSTGGADQPKAAVYVHTANPGPTVPDWPKSGQNSDGICGGGNTLACAQEYGEDLAKKDVAHMPSALVHTVWLDVEGAEDGYSWQPSTAKNTSAVEGMVEGFEANGYAVGIYSGTSDYTDTLGVTSKNSDLAGLPDWILGATTFPDARANCHAEGFTGQVVIAQIAGATLDKNIVCR